MGAAQERDEGSYVPGEPMHGCQCARGGRGGYGGELGLLVSLGPGAHLESTPPAPFGGSPMHPLQPIMSA